MEFWQFREGLIGIMAPFDLKEEAPQGCRCSQLQMFMAGVLTVNQDVLDALEFFVVGQGTSVFTCCLPADWCQSVGVGVLLSFPALEENNSMETLERYGVKGLVPWVTASRN